MEGSLKRRHRTGDPQTDFEEVKAAIEKRLFIGRLPPEAEEEELKTVFGEYGILTELKKVPGKGMAFVSFDTWAAAHRALMATDGRTALKGHREGQTLVASFAERSSVGRGGGAHLAKGLDNSRIFVGGLPEEITEDELRTLFQRFGELSGLSLLPAKSHRRCGFVNFSIWGEALDAIEQLDGTEYPGRSNGSSGDRLTVVLAEPKPGSGGGKGSSYGGKYDAYAYSGPAEASSTKRRRLDEYGHSDPSGKRAELENLKAEYLHAVDNGFKEDHCTELHYKLMAVRAQMQRYAYRSSAGYEAPWQGHGGGGSQWSSSYSRNDGDPDAMRLFVGALPIECTDGELRGLVEQLTFSGAEHETQILECRVLPGKGCGYLKMSSWRAAEEALDALHNREVTGWQQALRAKWASRKVQEGGYPPGYQSSPRRESPRSSSSSWPESRSIRDRGSSAGDGDVDRHRLFIGQLMRGTHSQTVASLFEPFGTVEDCRLLEEKGVAYVTFAHTDQAKRAKESMDGKSISGVSRGDGLNVQFAKPR